SALERSEKRYRQLVESASDMIYQVNGRGFFTYVNPVAIRVAGYSEQELIGRHFSELIARDYQHRAIEFYREQARKQVPGTYFEFPLVAKDGTMVWIGQNVRLQREGQKVIGFFAVARDITQRKHTERALIKARKRAEASSEAKKMFLANMSHEIRTPMNGILGMARLIGSSPLNDQQRTQLNAIQQSAEHLMVLLNDILDFSKIESGKLDLEMAGFKLKDMEEHLVRTLEIWAAEKDLLLLSHVDEQIAPVLLSDQVRLRQVLINLLSNAIKFTDRGKVELVCRLEKEQDGHQWIRFEVNDTGIGIEEENLAAIFESFTQADPSVTRKYGGTGLGLAICGRLVQLLGGKLQVNSRKDAGSSFYFTLKFAVGAPHDIAQTVDTKPTEVGSAHILVVEDNITNQYVTTSILENYGFTHRVAGNGQEALEALAEDTFDLILMDVQMPVMDGMEATRIIREELDSDIPIIALTANIVKGDHDKFLAMGMNETITKPFEPEHLQRAITSYIKVEKAPTRQLFDLSGLQDIAQGRSAVIQRMVTLFLEEVPRELEKMQTCYREGNRAEMGRIAHSLKPSFGFLRIHTLTELLRAIEQGDAMTADQLEDNIDELVSQSALVLSQLQEYAESEELVKS
ncbi:MAG: ATP-binding protein, partial [Bacteroidota bacterium]